MPLFSLNLSFDCLYINQLLPKAPLISTLIGSLFIKMGKVSGLGSISGDQS